MGYEVKLIVGTKRGQTAQDGPIVVLDIAQLELGTLQPFIENKVTGEETQRGFFYGSDHDQYIEEDEYGNYMYLLNPEDVMRKLYESDPDSIRCRAALSYLQTLVSVQNNIVCLLYGH